jgi:hypothetical protein
MELMLKDGELRLLHIILMPKERIQKLLTFMLTPKVIQLKLREMPLMQRDLKQKRRVVVRIPRENQL